MKSINLFGGIAALLGAVVFAGTPLCAAEFTLENDQVALTCVAKGGLLLPGALRDKKTGETVKLGGDLFSVVLTNGGYLHSSEFRLVGQPRVAPLPVNLGASRRAEQLPGSELVADLASRDGRLTVSWHAVLRRGSRYLRQEFTFSAGKKEVPLSGFLLLELNAYLYENLPLKKYHLTVYSTVHKYQPH